MTIDRYRKYQRQKRQKNSRLLTSHLVLQIRFFFDVVVYDASFCTAFRRLVRVIGQVGVKLTQILLVLLQLLFLHNHSEGIRIPDVANMLNNTTTQQN